VSKNLVALAVPFFFLFMGVELAFARARRRRAYRFNDAFADLGCGIVQQALGLFYGATLLSVHARAQEHALLELRPPLLVWGVALLGVDFLYYWWHRASHRVRLLWAAHVVHHQSEDMNFAVALRQAPLTNFTIVPFYLPLSLLGVPPFQLAVAASLNTLYQFWIHTELIPKLGPLEWVLNTPSHHRAHHGVNPRYIDKNYGGTLIVWDRLFGTFEEESEPVVYGTTEPLRSFDPLWAQLEPVLALARGSWRAPRLADKALIWLAPPEWSPRGVPAHAPPQVLGRSKWDVATTPRATGAVFFLLALSVVTTFLLLLFHARLSPRELALAVSGVLAALLAGAGLIRRGAPSPR